MSVGNTTLHGPLDCTHFHGEEVYGSYGECEGYNERSDVGHIDATTMTLGCRERA